MQFERFKARSAVSEDKQSGICANKFDDKSSECNVFARGTKLEAEIEVIELSARLRCLRKRHLDEGSTPVVRRLELLPRELYQVSEPLECELPDPDRLTLYDPLIWLCTEPVCELVGRTGELLLGLPVDGVVKSAEPDRTIVLLRGSRCSSALRLELGDPGAEFDFTSSA